MPEWSSFLGPETVSGVDGAEREAADWAARRAAASLTADLRAVDPGSLALRGTDLGPALEQQIFFRLRADGADTARAWVVAEAMAWARVAGVGGMGLASLIRTTPERNGVLALVRQEVHLDALALIGRELQAIGGPPIMPVRIGPAANRRRPAEPFAAPSISAVLDPRLAPAMAAHQLRLRRLRASRAVPPEIGAFAHWELGRIAAGVIGVESAVRRFRPRLIVSFDEIGTWARVIPAVARRAGIPTLDLPHAEAADAAAIAGAAYDEFAVYGARARQVVQRAGVEPSHVHEIGAPRFDPLIAAARAFPPAASRPTVLFAGQYVTGRLTDAGLAATYRAALAAAAATSSPLLVVPHPAQPPGSLERLMAEHPPAPGTAVTVAADGLHAALAEAWLLVTGWSNSVMEAAIAGIPSITVDPGGVAPVDFAAEGLSVLAIDEASAAAAASRLQAGPPAVEAVARARAVLVERVGPLDGHASERAAHLMRSLVERNVERGAPLGDA